MTAPFITQKQRLARGFSLIELMIVIVILGALVALVMPAFEQVGPQVINSKLSLVEVRHIEQAYQRFLSDTSPANDQYPYLARLGFYPLVSADAPLQDGSSTALDFSKIGDDEYRWHRIIRAKRSPENANVGWNGPYLTPEANGAYYHKGETVSYLCNMTNNGQNIITNGTFAPPLVFDPHFEPDLSNHPHYYRIIASRNKNPSNGRSTTPWRLSLVFTGANGVFNIPNTLIESGNWVDNQGYINADKMTSERTKTLAAATGADGTISEANRDAIFDDQVFPLTF